MGNAGEKSALVLLIHGREIITYAPDVEIAPAGDRALLVTLPEATPHELQERSAALRADPRVLAAIVGHSSIYVILNGPAPVWDRLSSLSSGAQAGKPALHVVPVSFNGPDFPDFISRAPDFFDRLPSVKLTARYLGFRAGFAYLDGWPAEWAMPRRPTSRNRVPRGSFGIAAAVAGFYPIESPGGWNLLGRTNVGLWDPRREPPNLLAPGDEIRIVADDSLAFDDAPLSVEIDSDAEPVAEVIAPGQLTRIAGAPDWRRVEHGLAPGGAFDAEAAAFANALCGNGAEAGVLECVLVGPRLRLHRRGVLVDSGLNIRELRGEVDVGRVEGRAWLAIEGGIDLGVVRYAEAPRIIGRGDVLREGTAGGSPADRPAGRRRSEGIRVMGELDSIDCEVTPQIDRVGIRLRPLQPLAGVAPADLPSCGMQFGTIQRHPDGSLVIMGPDHPITGGYAQVATVLWDERWKLARLMPGEHVRLQV